MISKNYRWFIIFLAFLASIINYMDRSALSYAITPLQKTFGLNNADFGVIASGFGVGYMIMTVFGGLRVDRWGSHKMWTISAITWSIMCALLRAVTGFWMFVSCWVLQKVPHFPHSQE